MKILLSLVVVCLALNGVAEARLGESFEECEKRYGKSQEGFEYEVDDNGAIKESSSGGWVKSGGKKGKTIRRWFLDEPKLMLEIIFEKNKAIWISYSRIDGERFSEEFALALIKKNLSDALLSQVKKTKQGINPDQHSLISRDLEEVFWTGQKNEYAVLRTWQRKVSTWAGETEYRDCSELNISAEGFAKPQIEKSSKEMLNETLNRL